MQPPTVSHVRQSGQTTVAPLVHTPPEQTSGFVHASLSVQAVPSGCFRSGGHVVLAPVQVSAASHCPVADRHVVPPFPAVCAHAPAPSQTSPAPGAGTPPAWRRDPPGRGVASEFDWPCHSSPSACVRHQSSPRHHKRQLPGRDIPSPGRQACANSGCEPLQLAYTPRCRVCRESGPCLGLTCRFGAPVPHDGGSSQSGSKRSRPQ